MLSSCKALLWFIIVISLPTFIVWGIKEDNLASAQHACEVVCMGSDDVLAVYSSMLSFTPQCWCIESGIVKIKEIR